MYLAHLLLNTNQLHGTIPSELGQCNHLNSLSLNNNMLSGTLASELGSFPSLQRIYLSTNQLEGTLPKQMTRMTTLQIVDFAYNRFTGSMLDVNSWTSLSSLGLDNNNFDGTLGLLSPSMTEFIANNNSVLQTCLLDPSLNFNFHDIN